MKTPCKHDHGIRAQKQSETSGTKETVRGKQCAYRNTFGRIIFKYCSLLQI